MRKVISVGLGLLLFFMSMSPVFIRPSVSLAVDSGQASVVETVGDGLRYYVVFEYKGNRFRSDNMGSAFNMKMWERLTESDRRKVCRNYAFAPDYRKEQFGEAGSSAMVDWKNEVSGWKAAGEAWENAIGAREYPDLTAYFTGNGYNNLRVGDNSLADIEAELRNLSPKVKETVQYESAFQLTQEIDQEYAAGQAIYEKLVEIKAKQVGNAFKAGSEVLIKDIIIDNLMVPSITPSAKKASELIAGCISFLKDRCAGLLEDLLEEPSVAEILQAMQDMLDTLERTDDAIIDDINTKLEQLSSQMETLRSLQQQETEERQQQREQKETTLTQNADITFSWSEDSVDYGIPDPDPEMSDEEKEAKRTQVQAEADDIKTEFEVLLNGVIQRKNQAYAMLDYDDGQVLTDHPGLDDKYFANLWVWPDLDGPVGPIDMSNRIDPASYFSYYSPYSATKATIASGGAEIANQWDESISDLEEYIEEVENFISDQTLCEGLNSIEEKINGLDNSYSSYIGGSLREYVFAQNTHEVIRSSMEIMLSNQNQSGFYGPFGTDYEILAIFNDQKATVEKTMDDFAGESAVFESDIVTGAFGYNTLYTNLQNSATFMYGAYTSLKNIYRDSPYITLQGGNVPAVDEDHVDSMIAAATEEQKDAVVAQIIDDLRELRASELEYLHKINTGKNNVTYDANQLDHLLRELGIHGNPTAYANLAALMGQEITDSSSYLQDNDELYRLYRGLDIVNLSNISQVVEMLEGTCDAYYELMIIADEIELKANQFRSMSNDDFDTAFVEYKDALDGSTGSTYGLNQVQISNVWAQYNRGYDKLLELRQERYPDENPVLVDAIYLVLAGTDTPANHIELSVGEICRLEADIYPADATNRQIFWSTDNPDVAIVNAQGLVSAVAEGTACITAASADGNADNTCYVMVGGGEGESQIGLEAAKAAAAAKVQADYTAASWAILTAALALPENTDDEITAKTAAINNAIAGLVRRSGNGSSGSSTTSSPTTRPTTPPPATPPTATEGTTTASTSTTATLNTATGTATAPVNTAAMTTLTNQAIAAENAGQKAVVAIIVEAAPEAKAVQLEIPKTSFAAVANDTQADVQIQTSLATITLDNRAVATINNASSTGDVSISVTTVNTVSLSPQAQTIVGDRPVYDFSVKAGNTEVSSFEGGKAKISIPYTPLPGEQQESIVVYYIDNNQNLVPVRGAFNPATNTVDFEATHFSQYAVGYNEVSFQDVKDGNWYSKAVKFMAARGIISGIGNGYFGPDQKLTRGQYVVMVMNAYGIDPESNPAANFADAGNTYYTGYLAAAKKLNIVNGIGNNRYAPERLITRQEMFTMLYNTLQIIGELPEIKSGSSLDDFGDAEQIASWARPAIKMLVETGTVSGSEGSIKPVASSSRAEMAQVLYSLLNR